MVGWKVEIGGKIWIYLEINERGKIIFMSIRCKIGIDRAIKSFIIIIKEIFYLKIFQEYNWIWVTTIQSY